MARFVQVLLLASVLTGQATDPKSNLLATKYLASVLKDRARDEPKAKLLSTKHEDKAKEDTKTKDDTMTGIQLSPLQAEALQQGSQLLYEATQGTVAGIPAQIVGGFGWNPLLANTEMGKAMGRALGKRIGQALGRAQLGPREGAFATAYGSQPYTGYASYTLGAPYYGYGYPGWGYPGYGYGYDWYGGVYGYPSNYGYYSTMPYPGYTPGYYSGYYGA